jgi:hypothetical protein
MDTYTSVVEQLLEDSAEKVAAFIPRKSRAAE